VILKKESGSVLTREEVEGVRRRKEEESGMMESASMEECVLFEMGFGLGNIEQNQRIL